MIRLDETNVRWSLSQNRRCHKGVVAGGANQDTYPIVSSEVFDPITEPFMGQKGVTHPRHGIEPVPLVMAFFEIFEAVYWLDHDRL